MLEKYIPERRLIKRMTNYWEALKDDDILPLIQKFNSSAIADIWGNCFHLSISEDTSKRKYKYEHVGPEVVKAYGKNPEGQYLSTEIYSVPGASILRKIDESVNSCTPLTEQGQFINHKSQVVKYRSCIIPFGKGDRVVTDVIIGLSWRVF